MEQERMIDDLARTDSTVVWPKRGLTLRNAYGIALVIAAIVVIFGLIDVLVARGALGLLG